MCLLGVVDLIDDARRGDVVDAGAAIDGDDFSGFPRSLPRLLETHGGLAHRSSDPLEEEVATA